MSTTNWQGGVFMQRWSTRGEMLTTGQSNEGDIEVPVALFKLFCGFENLQNKNMSS